MEEIALDAGLGKASLYYYYPTKDVLFRAVIMNEHASFLRSVRKDTDGGLSASEEILRYVNNRFEYFSKLLGLNILDARASGKTNPVLRGTYLDLARQELQLLCKIIERGIRQGEFKVQSARRTAEALMHVMQGLRARFLYKAESPHIEPRERHALKKETLFVADIFLRGIQKT